MTKQASNNDKLASQPIANAENLTTMVGMEEQKIPSGPHPAHKPGRFTVFWTEFSTIFKAHYRLKYHYPLLLLIPTTALLVYSLSVAFLYFQLPNTPEAAPSRRWVLVLNALYYTTTSNLQYFNFFEADRHRLLASAEIPIAGVQFGATALWFGRYLAEMPFRIALAIIGSAIIYPIVGLRNGFGWYLLYLLGLTLQALGNGAFGLAIAAAFANPLLGSYATVVGYSFNILFSGSLYKSSTVTWILLWLRYLSVSFFVSQILIYDQFVGVTYPNTKITGDDVLKVQGWLVQPLSISIIGSISHIIIFNVAGIFCLWLTSRPRKLKK